MPTNIPFATSSYERSRANTPEQILRNWIVEKDESASDSSQIMLLQRPGLTASHTLPGNIQAVIATNNATAGFPQLLAVAGSSLYSLDGSSAVLLGSMDGTDARVAYAINFDRVVIISAGKIWCYGASVGSTTNSFRQIPNPESYTPCDVAMINDYFVIAMTDGTYYWIVPSEDDLTSVSDDALHFASDQSLPDGLVGVRQLSGNLFFLGGNSVEVWQPQASADQPFIRLTGQDYARGCLSRDTIQACDNTLIWVGEDAKVYRAANVPEMISTSGINERIKLRTGLPSAWVASYDGHLFYVLAIPGQGSFSYDVTTKLWSEWASEGSVTFRGHVASAINDTVYVGDSASGAIWTLSDSPTDAGTLIRRTASASIVIQAQPVRLDSFAADVGSSGACTWRLRWCDADEDITTAPWEDISAEAGASTISLRRLGAARAPFRHFELEITDPVTSRFSSARAGGVWR